MEICSLFASWRIIMKIMLITGGAGFIGSHIADYFLKKGDEVVILDNLSSGRVENIPKNAIKP